MNMRAAAAAVVARHLGERPRRLEPLSGGLNNHVFRAVLGRRRMVVRLHDDAAKVAVYRNEAWAMRQAQRARIPVPGVLAVGSDEAGRPYMLLEEVPGVPGTHTRDSGGVMRELGALASRLHRLPAGHSRASGDNSRHWTRWADYLASELKPDERLGVLDALRALTVPEREALQATLSQMLRWRRPPVLLHGDLRLKNLIIGPDDDRIRALIDWEDCLTAPAPEWDLSIALHDLGPDDKEAFLEGYGLTPARFARIAPAVRALNILNYAWAMRQGLEEGQRERVAWLKARLRGVFDLGIEPR